MLIDLGQRLFERAQIVLGLGQRAGRRATGAFDLTAAGVEQGIEAAKGGRQAVLRIGQRGAERLDVAQNRHHFIAYLIGQGGESVGTREGEPGLGRGEAGLVGAGNDLQRGGADQSVLAQFDAGVGGDEAHLLGIDFDRDIDPAVVAQLERGDRADPKTGDAYRLAAADVLRRIGDEAVFRGLAERALAHQDGEHDRGEDDEADQQKAPQAAPERRGVAFVIGQDGHETPGSAK